MNSIKKGFTLIELVIVIVIVGVLSIIAVPIYRGYTRKAMLTEGQTLIGAIARQEKVYYSEFAEYANISKTSVSTNLNDILMQEEINILQIFKLPRKTTLLPYFCQVLTEHQE